MNPVIARKLLECYTDEAGLGSLGFLLPLGKDEFAVKRPKAVGPWRAARALQSAYLAK